MAYINDELTVGYNSCSLQETLEEAIVENMELFDMSRIDATLEALMQFRTQGVDLSNFTMPEGT